MIHSPCSRSKERSGKCAMILQVSDRSNQSLFIFILQSRLQGSGQNVCCLFVVMCFGFWSTERKRSKRSTGSSPLFFAFASSTSVGKAKVLLSRRSNEATKPIYGHSKGTFARRLNGNNDTQRTQQHTSKRIGDV